MGYTYLERPRNILLLLYVEVSRCPKGLRLLGGPVTTPKNVRSNQMRLKVSFLQSWGDLNKCFIFSRFCHKTFRGFSIVKEETLNPTLVSRLKAPRLSTWKRKNLVIILLFSIIGFDNFCSRITAVVTSKGKELIVTLMNRSYQVITEGWIIDALWSPRCWAWRSWGLEAEKKEGVLGH